MTEAQGAMTDLIAYIAHPPQVLASSNAQHRRLLAAVRERDAMRAARVMAEHLQGTEHILAGLLPEADAPRRLAELSAVATLAICAPTAALDIRPRSSLLSRLKDGQPNLFFSRGRADEHNRRP